MERVPFGGGERRGLGRDARRHHYCVVVFSGDGCGAAYEPPRRCPLKKTFEFGGESFSPKWTRFAPRHGADLWLDARESFDELVRQFECKPTKERFAALKFFDQYLKNEFFDKSEARAARRRCLDSRSVSPCSDTLEVFECQTSLGDLVELSRERARRARNAGLARGRRNRWARQRKLMLVPGDAA